MKTQVRKIFQIILVSNLAALLVIGLFLWKEGSFPLVGFPQKPTLPYLGIIQNFELVEKNGQPFTLDNLMKRPWVASFMFTTCAGQCPAMNAKLEKLQRLLPEGLSIVSFSVDPLTDTPAVLRSYAKNYNADEGKWFFLTGDKRVIDKVLNNFYMNTSDNPALHSLRFVLVDSAANIRGFYDSMDEDALRQLVKDSKRLMREPYGR
ncbi:MAG: SCO family protein [Candidatus Omnitrophica bacterium]|nr:SCO family protein [Candidatus Omnitrophota bacterium]